MSVITTLADSNGAKDLKGDPVMVPIGDTQAIAERGGWVYLANQVKGLRTLDLDPVTIEIEPKSIILANRITSTSATSLPLSNTYDIEYKLTPMGSFVFENTVVTLKEGDTAISGPTEIKTCTSLPVIICKGSLNITGRAFDPGKVYTLKIVVNEKTTGTKEPDKKIVRVPLEWPVMVTDYNRDKKIDEDDWTAKAEGKTFYFWINDDDDKGEVCSDCDIPNSGKNFKDAIVNGMSDLEDFFPVFLDLKEVLKKFPATTHDYKLIQEDEAVNVVFTDLTPATAGKYLTDPAGDKLVPTSTTVPQKALVERDTHQILRTAYTDRRLNNHTVYSSLMTDIKDNGKGIILMEGRKKTNKPLVLEVIETATNAKVFTSSINISIDGVETMFRHINLIKEMARIEVNNSLGTSISVTPITDHPMPAEVKRGKDHRLDTLDFKEASNHFIGFSSDKSGDFVQEEPKGSALEKGKI